MTHLDASTETSAVGSQGWGGYKSDPCSAETRAPTISLPDTTDSVAQQPRTYRFHADERAEGVQTCAKCGETKPLSAFGIDHRSETPRSWCHWCQAAATRDYKARNRDRLNAARRGARKRP